MCCLCVGEEGWRAKDHVFQESCAYIVIKDVRKEQWTVPKNLQFDSAATDLNGKANNVRLKFSISPESSSVT